MVWMPENASPIFEFFYNSTNNIYHILEKQENPLELFEEQYDCQGECLLFPSINIRLLLSELKEDHGVTMDEERDAVYFYSKKGEILELRGLYRALNLIWDKTSPLLHRPFMGE